MEHLGIRYSWGHEEEEENGAVRLVFERESA
jgi:hypothetical protein